jgi:hypothetical protein
MSAASDDNKDSPSSESDIDAGRATPGARPHLTLRQAAAELRLTSRQVRDLVTTGTLAGFLGRDERGAATAYVYADAVRQLAERIDGMTP